VLRNAEGKMMKKKRKIYDHPPVSLWKSSSLSVWLASLDRIERKM